MNHEIEAKAERAMLDDIIFWGIHDFWDHPMVVSCTRCGWGFHDGIHTGKVAG